MTQEVKEAGFSASIFSPLGLSLLLYTNKKVGPDDPKTQFQISSHAAPVFCQILFAHSQTPGESEVSSLHSRQSVGFLPHIPLRPGLFQTLGHTATLFLQFVIALETHDNTSMRLIQMTEATVRRRLVFNHIPPPFLQSS